MIGRRLVVLALALATPACRPEPEPIAPRAAADAVSRIPCRCRGVESGAAFLDEAQEAIARSLLRGPKLPAGWTAAGNAAVPAADDALWLAATAAPGRLCATVQELTTPVGPVRVLVAALDASTVPGLAAAAVNAAAPAGTAPAIVSRTTLTLLSPGDRGVAAAWSDAANAAGDDAPLAALRTAAEADDAEAFDAAFASATAARPHDAMPWAFKAGFLVRRGEHGPAKLAAQGALVRAERDPEATAEALHWQFRAERATGASAELLASLADRAASAAASAGNEPMRARSLFDRAVARADGGDDDGALADLRQALALERRLGGSTWRDAAAGEEAFARLREARREELEAAMEGR